MGKFEVAEVDQPIDYSGYERSSTRLSPYLALYYAEPMERIATIRQGVAATEAKTMLDDLSLGQDFGLRALGLSVATVNKKAKIGDRLSVDESERVIGFARLIGQLEAMIEEAGDGSDFDAYGWMGRWLTEPLPALGQIRPADLIDTMEGQALVGKALAQIQSGAYA